MEEHVLHLKLVRKAKSKGGDKYESRTTVEGEKPLVFYIPQHISRHEVPEPIGALTVTIKSGI